MRPREERRRRVAAMRPTSPEGSQAVYATPAAVAQGRPRCVRRSPWSSRVVCAAAAVRAVILAAVRRIRNNHHPRRRTRSSRRLIILARPSSTPPYTQQLLSSLSRSPRSSRSLPRGMSGDGWEGDKG